MFKTAEFDANLNVQSSVSGNRQTLISSLRLKPRRQGLLLDDFHNGTGKEVAVRCKLTSELESRLRSVSPLLQYPPEAMIRNFHTVFGKKRDCS